MSRVGRLLGKAGKKGWDQGWKCHEWQTEKRGLPLPAWEPQQALEQRSALYSVVFRKVRLAQWSRCWSARDQFGDCSGTLKIRGCGGIDGRTRRGCEMGNGGITK